MVFMQNLLRGKDFITTQEWTKSELETMLDVACDLKRKFVMGEPHEFLKNKTLFMLFYNPSIRTRNSFEAGMTQLGGHAHYLTPETVYSPTLTEEEPLEKLGETREKISDSARVLDRYGHGIALRIFGKPTGWIYGRGNLIIREFARWSRVPVINMEDDMYHPCQAMADIMTIREKLKELKGRKLVMSWAYSPSPWKPASVPHSVIQICTMFGMDVVLSHPDGFELDPKVVEEARENARMFGGSLEMCNNMNEAFKGADVVYPKSWTSLAQLPPTTKKPDFAKIEELLRVNKDWICDQEKINLCKKSVIYMHCLPADRGAEVTNEVIDGPNSVVFDQAENRLHAQKAIMSLTLGRV